jgi:hypothetical protein
LLVLGFFAVLGQILFWDADTTAGNSYSLRAYTLIEEANNKQDK